MTIANICSIHRSCPPFLRDSLWHPVALHKLTSEGADKKMTPWYKIPMTYLDDKPSARHLAVALHAGNGPSRSVVVYPWAVLKSAAAEIGALVKTSPEASERGKREIGQCKGKGTQVFFDGLLFFCLQQMFILAAVDELCETLQ